MDPIEKFKSAKYIFVVGIGGSDLASKAVWSALTLHQPETKKKIFFLESPDSREYAEVESLAQNEIFVAEQITLIVISKSGKTVETLTAFHKVFDILSEKFGEGIEARSLIISTKDSPLSKLAEEKNIARLGWDGDVGGRWSAFTTPHTSVLSIAGLNAEEFVLGGSEMKEKCKEPNEENPAFKLAKDMFANYESGKDILDIFIFNSELEDLGKWCRQLVAESLGKENEKGKKVGLTPMVSIGPTDLHSMLQLDLGGPRNKFTIFIKSNKEIAGSVNEKSYDDVLEAYEREKLPFSKYEMPEINEKEIGKFMAFMMATVLELSNLLQVDPYDQPEVENYKKNITS